MMPAFGRIFLPIINVILPERARAARIRTKVLSDFLLNPSPHVLLGEHVTTLLDYKDAGVSDLVRALKYERSGHAAAICGQILGDFLREEISGLRAFSPRPIFLVPIPLHGERVRERGFNQMERVLSYLPREFRDGSLSKLMPEILNRTRATPQQARLSRRERITNVASAFAVTHDDCNGAHVILIDDVATTGATLSSAAQTLRAHGARVTSMAIARA